MSETIDITKLKLSELIRHAVKDCRAALATGKYEMRGHLWHGPGPTGVCAICLAGGILASRCGFANLRDRAPQDLSKEETKLLLDLDEVRSGVLPTSVRVTPGCHDKVFELVVETYDGERRMAPLETYEQVADILEEHGQ